MSSTGAGQRIYTPLPQNLTDSESEEELHNSLSVNRNQMHSIEKFQRDKIMKNGLSSFQHFPPSEEMDDQNGYAIMGMDSNIESVSILQDDKIPERMSILRKFFFVLSIFVCFLTVIIFLWVLPCSEFGQCSVSNSVKLKKSSWENPYHDIELKGAISVVDGAPGRDKNLVLLFRGDVINPVHSEGVRSSSDNGIILIVGNSGKVGWFIRQPRLPTDVDCSLIDVDKDDIKDCIVVGNEGLFATFNPVTGTIIWYLHNHDDSNKLFAAVDFPLVLMDVDGDGVSDMLASCTPYDSKNHNALILISGYRGSVIGTPLIISECMSINKLQIDKDRIVSFTCKNNTSLSESLRVITLSELFKSITNKPYSLKWDSWIVAKQHQVFGQRKETENQRNIYSIDGRKLIVENRGHCPKNCKVTVQLIDERSGKDNISWEYSAARVYGMVPATLVFNNSMMKNRIAGFVLKFWQWNVGIKNTNRYDRNVDTSTYSIFQNVFSDEHDDKNGKRPKRGHDFKYKTNENITLNHLTERVVLVTFNATDIHIVNASQSDIIQMCSMDKSDVICQPDMSFQENSLLIADLDGDGSQELITYLTSFVCTETASLEEYTSDVIKCDVDWKLRSTVRIVRLEAELPKLYEAVSHH
ncbi:uncharacterized protein LOC143918545 [Arctopsyche grandis]|uniref:uncharacterized protein LOC143918545 n=1 Tax=Arctopsyche grandis TaxID=121162 RepID=UPI00406D9889